MPRPHASAQKKWKHLTQSCHWTASTRVHFSATDADVQADLYIERKACRNVKGSPVFQPRIVLKSQQCRASHKRCLCDRRVQGITLSDHITTQVLISSSSSCEPSILALSTINDLRLNKTGRTVVGGTFDCMDGRSGAVSLLSDSISKEHAYAWLLIPGLLASRHLSCVLHQHCGPHVFAVWRTREKKCLRTYSIMFIDVWHYQKHTCWFDHSTFSMASAT